MHKKHIGLINLIILLYDLLNLVGNLNYGLGLQVYFVEKVQYLKVSSSNLTGPFFGWANDV